MKGLVYLLANPAMPGIVKIGLYHQYFPNSLKKWAATTFAFESFQYRRKETTKPMSVHDRRLFFKCKV